MQQYEPLGPDSEVLGAAMLGFLDAANVENIEPHLEAAGLTTIEPDVWYPKKQYLDLYNSMIAAPNVSLDFVSLGITVAHNAWPPDFDDLSFGEIMSRWNDVFDMVNRGEDRGYIRAEQIDDGHWRVEHYTPDPDDLNYGVVYGTCQRFLGDDTDFTVFYDEDIPRRERGGEVTAIHIEIE